MGGSSPASSASAGSNDTLTELGNALNGLRGQTPPTTQQNPVPPVGEKPAFGLGGTAVNPTSSTMSQEKRDMYGAITHPGVPQETIDLYGGVPNPATKSIYDPANTGIGPSADFLSAQQGYLNANPQKPTGGK
jgi:hypothetical protein